MDTSLKTAKGIVRWGYYVARKPKLAKYYRHWRNSLQGKNAPLTDEMPWVVYEAMDWLHENLNSTMRVFEWGSGGSTLFFAKHAASVVSVEHETEWYTQVSSRVRQNGLTNALLFHCAATGEGEKVFYGSSNAQYQNVSFEAYAKLIDNYPPASFDFVLVDGRARPACLFHAIPHIKIGGFLMLDDSDRAAYQEGMKQVALWKRRDFRGPSPQNPHPRSTTVWQKTE